MNPNLILDFDTWLGFWLHMTTSSSLIVASLSEYNYVIFKGEKKKGGMDDGDEMGGRLI